jgi:hypothetical protein
MPQSQAHCNKGSIRVALSGINQGNVIGAFTSEYDDMTANLD